MFFGLMEKYLINCNSGSVLTWNHHSFGSIMPGREYTSQSAARYRFGFNGKEKDDEISGDGNAIDFGARIYEGRLGKWLSLDPLVGLYPGLCPYNFALNNPSTLIDI